MNAIWTALASSTTVDPAIVLLARLALNVLFTLVVVRLVYYRLYRDRDYVFTYFLINLVTFSLAYLLSNVPIELGFALGLFAVFGILRYRTEAIRVRNLTYLFVVIGIALLNALANGGISLAERTSRVGAWPLEPLSPTRDAPAAPFPGGAGVDRRGRLRRRRADYADLGFNRGIGGRDDTPVRRNARAARFGVLFLHRLAELRCLGHPRQSHRGRRPRPAPCAAGARSRIPRGTACATTTTVETTTDLSAQIRESRAAGVHCASLVDPGNLRGDAAFAIRIGYNQ